MKLVEGTCFWEHCAGLQAEHSKFSAENYACSKKYVPRKEFRNSQYYSEKFGKIGAGFNIRKPQLSLVGKCKSGEY